MKAFFSNSQKEFKNRKIEEILRKNKEKMMIDTSKAELLRPAVNRGYHQGYLTGQTDRLNRRTSNYGISHVYRSGSYGYQSYADAAALYRHYFREGFRRGYEDGYNSTFRYGTRSGNNFNILGNILGTILQFAD